jgi:hypothetical protein
MQYHAYAVVLLRQDWAVIAHTILHMHRWWQFDLHLVTDASVGQLLQLAERRTYTHCLLVHARIARRFNHKMRAEGKLSLRTSDI